MNKTGLYRLASLFDAARDTLEALGGLRQILDEHTSLTKEVVKLRERKSSEELLQRNHTLSTDNTVLKRKLDDLQAELVRCRAEVQRLKGEQT